jgi:ribulose-5-phosphate 4-epimerase/fuculose-1-phosphate aldolase
MPKERNMNEFDTIQDLVHYTRLLYDRYLVYAEGGNTSIRIGDEVWITCTGSVLGRLEEEDLTRMTMDGEVLEGKKPSKEWPMHLAFYKAQAETKAVIHLHPTYSIAFTTLLTEATLDAIPAYSSALYRRAGQVPMIDYYPVGSTEMHNAIAELAPHFYAILLRQHGVTVASENLFKAIGIVEEIEQCCHIALLTNLKGTPIKEEEKEAIDKLQGRSWPKRID